MGPARVLCDTDESWTGAEGVDRVELWIARASFTGAFLLVLGGAAHYVLEESPWAPSWMPSDSPSTTPSNSPEEFPTADAGARADDEEPVADAAPVPAVAEGEGDVEVAGTEPELRPAREGTERAFYLEHLRRFRALDPDDPAALDAILARFVEEDLSDPERVAMLRASYDASSPLCAELFLAALEELPDEAERDLASVPSFAFRYLGERIGDDPMVREVLTTVLFEPVTTLAPELRRPAIARLVTASGPQELWDLRTSLARETDPLVRASVAAALANHGEERTAARVADVLGLDLPAPSEDAGEDANGPP